MRERVPGMEVRLIADAHPGYVAVQKPGEFGVPRTTSSLVTRSADAGERRPGGGSGERDLDEVWRCRVGQRLVDRVERPDRLGAGGGPGRVDSGSSGSRKGTRGRCAASACAP